MNLLTKYISLFIFLLPLVSGQDLSKVNKGRQWETIQEGTITIKTTELDGFPICQAESVLPYQINRISALIENIENYPNIFLRVTESTVFNDDVAHIVLDMPFPFSDRDYVIQYFKQKSGDEWMFRFKAVADTDFPSSDKYVRLIHATGEWKLSIISKNQTKVSYIWNGELLGDFPDWALERAWVTQGNEMIDWLGNALKN